MKANDSLGQISQNFMDLYNKGWEDKILRARLVNSPFQLVEDDKPVYLISTGAGIAPMMALSLQKSINNSKFGDFYFYFGCRNKNNDFLFEE